MSECSASPKRPRLEFDDNAKEDHHDKYRNQDDQGSYSTSRKRRGDTDDDDMKDCDDIKSKNDAARREHTLVMRLTNKEQELQECMNQIQEMKQAQTQNTAQLRSMLLDPAINLVFQRMSKEMDEHKEKLKQKQNELNAWKFTPDSQTGMRLMGKCRMLLQENGELGKTISSGRTAKLEGEISLHKALAGEMKKNQKELDEFVGELEEDVEGMQGMIFMLQQQLKEAREQISRLQQENEQLRTLQIPSEPDPGGEVTNGSVIDGKKRLLSSSSSQFTNSSHHPADHSQPKSANSSQLVPNTLIPLTNSSDSALTPSSTGDLSPTPPSVKVTPDSGVQTQEDDDDTSAYATDSPLVDETTKMNSTNECHISQSNTKSFSADEKSDNQLRTSFVSSNNGDSQEKITRTTACDDDHCESSLNHAVPKSSVHERTSPTAAILKDANGDVSVSTNEDSLDGVERNHSSGEVVQGQCVDEENQLDMKLTHISCDKTEELRKCLTLEQDGLIVNSVKSNLTNGSSEDVTTNMDTN